MTRLKNIEAFCSTCNTITKMEISGEVTGEENENKKWAKCKKCKQTMVIDADISSTKVILEGIENSDYTTYSPLKTFKLGETIYHQNWDDYGKVVTKETLSNGRDSIAVEFQKSGLKKLIESLKI